MKKIIIVMRYLTGLFLSIALSACSYHTIQTDTVSAEQIQENAIAPEDDPEKQSSEKQAATQTTETAESSAGKASPEPEYYATEMPPEQGYDSSGQDKRITDTPLEARDAPSPELKILPEELDDGSNGEHSNTAEKELSLDKEKTGNSNINREGRDTYLMKEGKPKRFWNLQRQL